MKLLQGLWQLATLLYLLVWAFAVGNVKHLRALKATPPDLAAQRKSQWWFKHLLSCLNVQVSVSGQPAEAPCLVVGNHISWLDIAVLGSVMPVVFLGKGDIIRWPVISRIARTGGSLFIERGTDGAARQSIVKMKKAFKRQQSVAIFPEGTTGMGQTVLAFHPRLFAAAIESKTRVQPVALRYPHPKGVHPKVPFVDKESLVSNIWGLLGCRSIQAVMSVGPVIDPEGLDRRHLADRAREYVVGIVEGGQGEA